jgi:dTDP-4-dehydrorhamnose reductase
VTPGEPRLVVFGAGGQVGRALGEAAAAAGLSLAAYDRGAADVADPAAVEAALGDAERPGAPAVVVNAAAFTAVDRAETEPARAFAVNRDGARSVAAAGARRTWPLIHLSTDYVFGGGADRPRREDDPPAPVNRYGASKLAGEAAVLETHARAVILRTAWVYGPHGSNFVKTMLRLGAERPQLRVVQDQFGSPTAAAAVALAVLALARRLAADPAAGPYGIYHFAGAGTVSRFAFAQAIFAEAARHGRPGPALLAVPSDELPTAAPRPANTALDCARIARDFGIAAPPWRDGLAPAVDAICGGPQPVAAVVGR